MDWIPQIFRRRKFYEDLSEEIRLHIEERTEQLMCDGMSAEEATWAARQAFGNRTLLEERSRAMWQWPTLESIGADLRFALLQLRSSPGFAVIAVLTLAIAIGANAVVFAVLNGLFLRPLNVPHGESLYAIQRRNDTYIAQSYPDYLDLRDRNRSFDGLAAYNLSQVALDTGNNPASVWGYETSGNYFDELGVQPYLGRLFHASDEHGPNSAPYIVPATRPRSVRTHEVWRARSRNRLRERDHKHSIVYSARVGLRMNAFQHHQQAAPLH